MRRYLPILVPLLVVLQLLSSGVLGPRLRCTDADGRVSTELSAFRCCDRDEQKSCGSDASCDKCPSGSTPGDGYPIVGEPACSCVDIPDPTEVATSSRATDSDRLTLDAIPVPFVLLPIHTLPVLELGPPVTAFLPHGHAPPRLHIATIVLRI